MLTVTTSVKGSAGYVAIEKLTGALQGRRGSFVLQHSGKMNRGMPALRVTIEGAQHSCDFDYSLPSRNLLASKGFHEP